MLLFMCATASAQTPQPISEETSAEQTSAEREPAEALATDGEEAQPPAKAQSDSASSDAEIRVRGASEDPMNDSFKRFLRLQKGDLKSEPSGFDIYGSIRLRARDQNGKDELQDGGSRIGAEAHWQLGQDYFLFGRYEAGFNLLSNFRFESEPGEETGQIRSSLFTRLAYAGVVTPFGYLTAGKNWSTYYSVAGLTDRLSGTGGSASGTYNANSDGGATGTGRADNVLQSKLSLELLPHKLFKPFNFDVQVQQGNPIPYGRGAEYGTAFGISALMTTQKNFTIGVAYNYAEIDLNTNPSLRDIGINGSSRALLIGTRAFGKRWYAALLVSRLENHEATNDGIYFHGWGSELYAQYQLTHRLWLAGGYNLLKPDSDQVQAGAYEVDYSVLELKYSIADFRRYVFANVKFDNSTQANGIRTGNVYTIGIQWDLSKRGWQTS